MTVYDLRGLALDDPARKLAYPDSPLNYPAPMRYSHLMSTRWYFDASKPENSEEAARVIGDLCFAGETWKRDGSPYKPLHIVVDNFGGTIVGEHRAQRKTVSRTMAEADQHTHLGSGRAARR